MTKEELITQTPEGISLRKYRSSLIASGGAIMLFALWTVLRSIVQLEQLSSLENGEALRPVATAVLVMSCVDLVFKLYVGMSARVEGLNRGKKRPYLTLGIIIAVLSAIWVIYMIADFSYAISLYGVFGAIAALAVEATALYAELDMVISAIRVRRLEKEMGRA